MNQDQVQGSMGQISPGTTVYDAAGEKVGIVREYNAQAGYLDVEKGWLFPRDFYVPVSAVQSGDAGGIYLTIYKDDLEHSDQYTQPPVGGTVLQSGAATTIGGTVAGDVGTMQTEQAADIRIPVREEELIAGKRAEEIGQVHLHKDVVAEQQTVNVPLQQERVTVERVPVSGEASAADVSDAFVERDIDVPVMGEEAVVEKRVRAAEEVRVRKDVVTEQQQVSDTVRKERVVVEGADEVQGEDIQTTVRGTDTQTNINLNQ